MTDLLIIGKNGQLGKEFVKISKKLKINFKAYSKKELDITNFSKAENIITKERPKTIINTAAFHVTSECEEKPLLAFEANCVAVKDLARIAKSIKAKLVTYSTNYVFDGEKGSSYSENDNTNPLQMYGLSKLAGEIAALNEYPTGTFVIRTCGVYGGGRLGSRSKRGNYILKILNEAKTNSIIRASKRQIVNPTFAGDLAVYTLKLLELNPKPGIYHLVNEGFYSWYEFAKKILKLKGIKKSKVQSFEEDEENKYFKSPLFSALKNTKAKKLGIILPSIDEGLRKYLKEI